MSETEDAPRWAIWREAYMPTLVVGWLTGNDRTTQTFASEADAMAAAQRLWEAHRPEVRDLFTYRVRPYEPERPLPMVDDPSLWRHGAERFDMREVYAAAVERIKVRRRAEQQRREELAALRRLSQSRAPR